MNQSPEEDVLQKLEFVDIGFNITDSQFRGYYNGKAHHESDLAAVLARAQAAGVTEFLCTGSCIKSSKESIEQCRALNEQAKKQVAFATVGIHPCSAKEFMGQTTLDELKALVLDNLDVVRAFGEIGLDAQRENWCPLEQQKEAFREQLRLAVCLGLPLFLHNRDTSELFIQIIDEIGRESISQLGGVVHSFDGTLDEAKTFIDLGFDIGINGCGLRTDASLQMLRARELPLSRVHFETDAPWCLIKPTHPSHDLLIWTRSEMNAVKSAKHDANNIAETVKGRCEPMYINQVAEVLYRTLVPSPHTLDGFKVFCAQIRANSIRLLHKQDGRLCSN